MKKFIHALCNQARDKFVEAGRYLFGNGQRRSTAIALALTLAAPAAKAVDLSDLGNAANFICLIQAYVSGPVLFGLGIVLIIVGAVAIANSESNIGKLISSVIVGLGIASCALPIVKNQLKIGYTCA
ncbi:conjugal transfer protein TrbC [Burkholderia sp. Ac-20345]|uniref:conjugal transfer protein TrbC n=1 Tax=Burkholderia sp. Ac-20345 TaxID=2703891 RepID=UPI00197BE8CD|nr:conjugal transfer protein TrbC [Burkholderia sp. Ac-20345]